jgi:DNA-binding winged helix-turn-helix (wHTH) protein
MLGSTRTWAQACAGRFWNDDRLSRSEDPVNDKSRAALLRFGTFELDLEAEQLLKNGRLVHLQPQPFKLLCLLTSQTGKLVTREEIRAALWKDDTFVDFEQGVNFAVKQVREALSDQAEHPVYIQTMPKRGYKFLVPVSAVATHGIDDHQPATVDSDLNTALWANIAELRLSEERSNRRQKVLTASLAVLALALVIVLLARSCG